MKYHQQSSLYGPAEQLHKLVTTLISRDLPLLVAVGLGIVAAVVAHKRQVDADTVAVLAWLVAGTLVLVFEPAMFRNHIASIIPPLALLVAMRPPPPRWAAVAAIFVIPWWASHLTTVLWARDYRGSEAALMAQIRALPPGAKIITDEPGFASSRRPPAPRQPERRVGATDRRGDDHHRHHRGRRAANPTCARSRSGRAATARTCPGCRPRCATIGYEEAEIVRRRPQPLAQARLQP